MCKVRGKLYENYINIIYQQLLWASYICFYITIFAIEQNEKPLSDHKTSIFWLLEIVTVEKQLNLRNRLGFCLLFAWLVFVCLLVYFLQPLNILAGCLPFFEGCCSFSSSRFSLIVVVNILGILCDQETTSNVRSMKIYFCSQFSHCLFIVKLADSIQLK